MSANAKTVSTNVEQKEDPSHRRAGALADRIEEGAALLAAFAEQLSEAEWAMPVSATDRRPLGVIVHHVASVYPLEIGAARAIAGGNAVTHVAWEAIADMNGKQALDQVGTSKADTLELLRRNSREAATAVRAFTDAELDQAAPFSLSFGAPITPSLSLRTMRCDTVSITSPASARLWVDNGSDRDRIQGVRGAAGSIKSRTPAELLAGDPALG